MIVKLKLGLIKYCETPPLGGKIFELPDILFTVNLILLLSSDVCLYSS